MWRRLGLIASLGLSVFVPFTQTTHVPAASAALTCGTTLLKGSQWLQGDGVDVHSNGSSQFTGYSCNGVATSKPVEQYGYGWQCVELAARLYRVRNWGFVYANGGPAAGAYQYGAKYLPEGSSGLTFYPVVSSYSPVPGDLVIEAGASFGHVSVVDHIEPISSTSYRVIAVEQNASVTGWHVYVRTSGTMTGGYHPIKGFLHSPRNSHKNVSTTRGYALIYADAAGNLLRSSPIGHFDFHEKVLVGSSPVTAATPSGSLVSAVISPSSTLEVVDAAGSIVATGISVASGTTPAIAIAGDGSPWVAVHAASGYLTLWHGNTTYRPTVIPAPTSITTTVMMRNGASPSIDLMATGATPYVVAVTNVANAVQVVTASGVIDSGLSSRPASDPAIAVEADGSYEIASVSLPGHLQLSHIVAGVAQVAAPLGYTPYAGTSPDIRSALGGYQVAFVGASRNAQSFGSLGSFNAGTTLTTNNVALDVRPDGMVAFALRDVNGLAWVVNKSAVLSTASGVTSGAPALALLR